MATSAENKNRYIALALTAGFNALLFLLFVFIVFVTPIPPFEIKEVPEVELDLGMEGLGNADAGGSGQNDTDIETNAEAATEPTPPVENNTAPPIITDETEIAVSVKTTLKTKPQQKTETETVTPKEEEPKPSTELLSALNALKSKKKHTGKGEGGDNTGGSGTGTQQGVGPGDDTGHGNNTPGYNSKGGYDLKGRLLVKKPERMSDSEEEGIVVVEIIVDETGKVIKATPGQRGSTTTSSKLFAKARLAALAAKFNPSATGQKEQRGTYTFVFLLE